MGYCALGPAAAPGPAAASVLLLGSAARFFCSVYARFMLLYIYKGKPENLKTLQTGQEPASRPDVCGERAGNARAHRPTAPAVRRQPSNGRRQPLLTAFCGLAASTRLGCRSKSQTAGGRRTEERAPVRRFTTVARRRRRARGDHPGALPRQGLNMAYHGLAAWPPARFARRPAQGCGGSNAAPAPPLPLLVVPSARLPAEERAVNPPLRGFRAWVPPHTTSPQLYRPAVGRRMLRRGSPRSPLSSAASAPASRPALNQPR